MFHIINSTIKLFMYNPTGLRTFADCGHGRGINETTNMRFVRSNNDYGIIDRRNYCFSAAVKHILARTAIKILKGKKKNSDNEHAQITGGGGRRDRTTDGRAKTRCVRYCRRGRTTRVSCSRHAVLLPAALVYDTRITCDICLFISGSRHYATAPRKTIDG